MMKNLLIVFVLFCLDITSSTAQNTIQAYSDASIEINVQKVPVNILGSSLNPVEIKNKSIGYIKEVIVELNCDCDKGAPISRKFSFYGIKGYGSGKDIISNIDCKGLLTNCTGQILSIKGEEPKQEPTKPSDDFWNGNPSKSSSVGLNKPSTAESHSSDSDYWGGSDQEKSQMFQGKSQSNNFWGGKGTFDEENYLKTHTMPKESNQFIGEIESRTKSVTVYCWDHGDEDGDRVRINHNSNVVQSDLYLRNSKRSFTVSLDFGMNRIDFVALSQGTSGPNTATFEVYDDSGRKISSKQWNINTGYSATLLVLKL